MATVAGLLAAATARLAASPSPMLDAELILAEVLARDRTWLRTWPEKAVTPEQETALELLLKRRQQGEPMAYILGHRGFWTLDLQVTPATLIPRPDTELLVETALGLLPAAPADVLDLGTGTGALALALAAERPLWGLTAVDISPEALAVAGANGERLGLKNVSLFHSHWYSALPGRRFGLIVSNPPYIAEGDLLLGEGDVRFEPRLALTSGPDGLDAIREIVYKAPDHLRPPGWLAFEHGHEQGEACRGLLRQRGFRDVETRRDLGGQERVTLGRWPC